MDQERRSQREMMQENEKQARTKYTNAQAKAAMSRRDNKASKLRVELTDPRKYGTNYENMDVIFAGPMAPNPSELLNGKVFAKLMIELKQRYDYVLIDTPPMANVVDAAIVGKVCDGAILLIESGFVGYRAAQKAIKQLEKSGTHMLGAVLNKVDARKEKYYSYYSYGSKYGYGYGQNHENE